MSHVATLRLFSSRSFDGDFAPAEGRLSLNGISFGLQQKIARRIGHVEIDIEGCLPQCPDSERLLSFFSCQRNRQSAGGLTILVIHQHHAEVSLAGREFRLPETQVHAERRKSLRTTDDSDPRLRTSRGLLVSVFGLMRSPESIPDITT